MTQAEGDGRAIARGATGTTQEAEPRLPAAPANDEIDASGGFAWLGLLFRNLVPFLRPHGKALVAILALLCIEMGLEALQRKAMSWLIDDAILKTDFTLLVQLLGMLFCAALVVGITALCREWMYSRLAAEVPGEVRSRIFEHVQRFPLQRLRTSTHGDLVSRMTSDAGSVEPAIWSLGYIAVALGGALFSLGMLLWTDWRLTLAGVALLPLAVVGPRILSPLAARESYAARKHIGALATHLMENLANQIVLRVFGLARVARTRFGGHNERIVEASRRYNVYSYYSHRVPTIVIDLLQLSVLGLGGWLVLRGEMTPGELVAFYLLFSALCNHIWSLTASVPNLIEASAGMRRIREILDQPVPDTREHDGVRFTDIGEGVRFESVGFAYEPDRRTLENVTLDVRPGELIAFVGGSGSGKSTALQLLLGLQVPTAGRIVIGGVDLQRIRLDDYWARVSAVFQDSLLFHTSIADNIRAGKLDATDEEIARAAKGADIEQWIRTLPDGYDTIVSGDTCSGGQRQRLAIARALIRDPALLVLDEPTSALDAATGAAVMRTLRSVAAGRTVVLVTHQLRDAAEASRIVVFEAGHAVECGTHAQLLARGGAYAQLWARQRDLATAPGAA